MSPSYLRRLTSRYRESAYSDHVWSRRVAGAAGALTAAVSLSGCGHIDELNYQPLTTPQEWCIQRPCIDVGDLVVAEPTSSVLVFTLALLWIGVGLAFLLGRHDQRSRMWFGASLILGGVAAGSAGISYQAFSYELKCAGREACTLTNGFEIAYSLLQVGSFSAMVVAVAWALAGLRVRRGISIYAVVNLVVYVAITVVGVIVPSALLLSFEVLLLFAVPALVMVAVLAWSQRRTMLGRRVLWVLILLVGVQVAYLIYFASGLTASFWASGVYFSANDVLHVGMVAWLITTWLLLRGPLRDRP